MRAFLIRFLNKLGIGITSFKNLERLREEQRELKYLRDFTQFQKQLIDTSIPTQLIEKARNIFPMSRAQLHQDIVALIALEFKSEGFFVEFGATDGIRFSNTFLLENFFGWKGILAEPAKKWHESLKRNREASIDTKCVWRVSGEKLEFNETEIGELSTLEVYSSGDMHADSRKSGIRYMVETISLEELLDTHGAPKFIDYLSVDTEGSEFEILRDFNFDDYIFGFITCEHNFTSTRQQVADLLFSKGYIRVFEHMSLFDDWFIHRSLVKSKGLI